MVITYCAKHGKEALQLRELQDASKLRTRFVAGLDAAFKFMDEVQEVHRFRDKWGVVHSLGPLVAYALNATEWPGSKKIYGWAMRCKRREIERRCDPATPVTCFACLHALATLKEGEF